MLLNQRALTGFTDQQSPPGPDSGGRIQAAALPAITSGSQQWKDNRLLHHWFTIAGCEGCSDGTWLRICLVELEDEDMLCASAAEVPPPPFPHCDELKNFAESLEDVKDYTKEHLD
ncbi:hypothetical protein VNO78_07392 [Psophocarpus tetragonolobus]|uniref:Uncharacterized protein n=1 Tax=Psophocarpus tetragonolobus TaxID=3891 RepID=A0AAN9T318_PSOTE